MELLNELVSRETKALGVVLDSVAYERLNIYAELLCKKNKVMNLTAITDERGIALKHFVDSLSLLYATDIKQGAKMIDVGTGAGFPGIVTLIARPDIELTLMDSTEKKTKFISEVLRECSLNATVVHMRAEDAGKSPEFREKYDIATARAVANLRELSEYCLPFVKVGGIFAAMKGAKAQEEIAGAEYAVKVLGGQIKECKSFEIEDCGERNIIMIKKLSHTSPKYPRTSSQIAKHPLIG